MTGPAVDLLIRAPRAVTGHAAESERPLAVGVTGGRIVAVAPFEGRGLAGRDTLELGADVVLLPGLVDSHVHVCEPGHTEWEGFASATRAAAAGGITTLVDMPLDSVPATVSVAALRVKQRAADGHAHVDAAFWGGVIPGNTPELEPLARAGVTGFKCFLADSGSPDFPPVDPRQLTGALHVTARLGLPLAWTQARRRGVGLAQVAAWMAAAPARLAGLTAKGRIAPGYDADFCVLAPEQSFVVDPGLLHHKHPATTPYAGRTLYGAVRLTLLRGHVTGPGQPHGQLLRRAQ